MKVYELNISYFCHICSMKMCLCTYGKTCFTEGETIHSMNEVQYHIINCTKNISNSMHQIAMVLNIILSIREDINLLHLSSLCTLVFTFSVHRLKIDFAKCSQFCTVLYTYQSTMCQILLFSNSSEANLYSWETIKTFNVIPM